MLEKITVAVASALAGGVLTYTTKALTLEGRIDAIERSVQRIEHRLFPPTNPPENHHGNQAPQRQ